MLCENRIKELLHKVQEDEGRVYLTMVDNTSGFASVNSVGMEHIEVIDKDTNFIIEEDYVEVIEVEHSVIKGRYKISKVLPFQSIVMIKYETKTEVTNIDSKEPSEITEDNGSCYIATYVYGDYDASEVLILRRFRDEKLLTNNIGTLFVKFYYKISPFLIKHFDGKVFKNTTKKFLDYIIKKLN